MKKFTYRQKKMEAPHTKNIQDPAKPMVRGKFLKMTAWFEESIRFQVNNLSPHSRRKQIKPKVRRREIIKVNTGNGAQKHNRRVNKTEILIEKIYLLDLCPEEPEE